MVAVRDVKRTRVEEKDGRGCLSSMAVSTRRSLAWEGGSGKEFRSGTGGSLAGREPVMLESHEEFPQLKPGPAGV